MRLFDSHAHLLDKRYDKDREKVLERTDAAVLLWNPGEDASLFRALISNKNNVWGACGIHPHDAKNADKEWRYMEELLSAQNIVAVGETGLDYHYMNSPEEIQKKIFRKHLELASEKELPVVIHSRQAFRETMDILKGFTSLKVLFHCFSEGLQEALAVLERGYFIAVGGAVTFPNAGKLREAVKIIPSDRLLLETDSPYLAPQAVRGKRNEPSFLKYIVEEVASVRGVSAEETAEITYNNAVNFFNVKTESA